MPWRKAEYDAASGVFECSTIFTACYCLLSLTLVARQNNNVRPMLTPEAVLVIRNGRPELYFTFSHINKIFELGVSENLQELANYFSVDNIEKEMRADIFIPNDTRIIDLDSYAFFVSSEELVASVCDTLKSVKDVPHILKVMGVIDVSSLELAFLPYLSRDKLLPQEVYLNQTGTNFLKSSPHLRGIVDIPNYPSHMGINRPTKRRYQIYVFGCDLGENKLKEGTKMNKTGQHNNLVCVVQVRA
ncbi:hypothetical protein R6Q59_036900 [Mikania micrantha]